MDLATFFWLSGGMPPRGAGGRTKKTNNWFESFKVDELKQLCRAAKFRVSGTKSELIARLMNDEVTGKFSFEKGGANAVGVGMKDVKDMCRERHLKLSGTKFELVLRILHHDKGTDNVSKKRAAADGSTGREVAVAAAEPPKKRAKTRTRHEIIYDKIKRKINSSATDKKYQSHWGSKCHASDVYELLYKVIEKECFGKKSIVTKKPKLALSLAKSAFMSVMDNFNMIVLAGYDSDGNFDLAVDKLETIATKAVEHLSESEVDETVDWITRMHKLAEPFGLGDCWGNKSTLLNIAAMLRGEDDQDAKPAAMETPGNSKENKDGNVSDELEEFVAKAAANESPGLVFHDDTANETPGLVFHDDKENKDGNVSDELEEFMAKAVANETPGHVHDDDNFLDEAAASVTPCPTTSHGKENQVLPEAKVHRQAAIAKQDPVH